MILVNKKLDFIVPADIAKKTNKIVVFGGPNSVVDVDSYTNSIEGVILDARPFDVTKYPNLKVISRVGVGVDNIDLDECKRRNIKVLTTPCFELTRAVSEFVIKQLLNLMSISNLRDNFSGKEVLIIGHGNIGSLVGRFLDGLGCNITFVDILPRYKRIGDTFDISNIDKFLPKADIVCIHVSGTDCVLDKQEIELLKDGCYVLNMARQGCVNTFELCSAMLNGKDLCFASDVDNPNLFSFPYNKELQKRVLITPHIASKTKAARMAMENMALDNLCEALNAK